MTIRNSTVFVASSEITGGTVRSSALIAQAGGVGVSIGDSFVHLERTTVKSGL